MGARWEETNRKDMSRPTRGGGCAVVALGLLGLTYAGLHMFVWAGRLAVDIVAAAF